ncbi:putative bifunctional diguanylate cyclase/phosphodiesterase [Vibrio methylphosphonaticus]|uniref:putative bifunctional diguanylate cyclase/phosphodiesterase n=1 Tax=Vibrio methylphosphonaticus TaxID=2946866 RepID=UPI00202A3123|nr:EAL domain-containing protein [Vibrio methylphosphonaticus]MCL9773667.1 EAL domain-containing protein [Vibrio methylphosphonaticus]
MRFKLKLQGQYTFVTFMLAVTLILISMSIHVWLSTKQSEQLRTELSARYEFATKNHLAQNAQRISDYLANLLVEPLQQSNMALVSQVLSPLQALPEIQTVLVLDKTANPIASDKNVPISRSESAVAHAYNLEQDTFKQHVETVFSQRTAVTEFQKNTFTRIQPIIVDETVIAALYISMTTDSIHHHVEASDTVVSTINDKINQQLSVILIAVSAVMLMFSAIAASIISKRWSAPISSLTQHTNAIGRGDFGSTEDIATIERNDEIGELSTAIRVMAAKLEQRTQKITHLAYHDALTDLPNRTQFIQHLQNTIKSYPATSFSVLFLDLDEFKVVNDNYGHDSGDFLLIRLAEKLTLCAKELTNNHPLTMISRIGGDEFLMLIPHLKSIQDVDSVVRKIFVAVRSPILMENEELVVGGSIGVARYPYNGKSADELIKHADIAMYRAKSDGKNTHKLFTPKMFKSVVHRANMERELRRSLADLKQFELWFQPLVCLKTGKTVGAESLVRWNHPTIGLISPLDFISIAEETAMILPLGQWLIESLCFQIQQWMPYFDSNFHASINISSKQLYRQNLVEMFAFYMEKYQVPPHIIRMEITESLLLQDEDEAEKSLKAIRKSGIEIWLDDFGTGYSSLSYLRRFTVDGIKIDQSFIKDITTDVKDQQLVQAMIAMAKNLDLLVVAEGIETREQARKLAQFGCQIGQGYYYDRPIPVDQFVNRLINESESNVIKL